MFPVQLTTSRMGNLTRLIHTLLYMMAMHTYIQGSPGLTTILGWLQIPSLPLRCPHEALIEEGPTDVWSFIVNTPLHMHPILDVIFR